MTTGLTLDQMKRFVRDQFEEFVNKRNTAVIRENSPTSTTAMDPGETLPMRMGMNR